MQIYSDAKCVSLSACQRGTRIPDELEGVDDGVPPSRSSGLTWLVDEALVVYG